MRKLFLITFSLLIASEVWALEPCPDNQPKEKWDNCTGTYNYSNGSRYVGEWKDGKRNGQATYTSVKNTILRQRRAIKKVIKRGLDPHTYKNGVLLESKYVGGYKDDKRHGQGTYTHWYGSKYVGGYKDDKRHGQGTYTSDSSFDGNEYVGEWKYVGEYQDDKRHGQGTYTSAHGFKYVGEYKDGKRNGQGTYTWGKYSDWAGDKYVGEWKDDKRHGQGTYNYVSGKVYEGLWIKGEPQGKAQYPYSADETREVILTALFDRCSQFGWISDDDIKACIKQEAYRDLQMQQQQYEMRLLEERLLYASTPEPRPFFLDLLSLYAQQQQIKQTKQMQKDIQRLKASNRSMRSRQNTQQALKFLYQGRGD